MSYGILVPANIAQAVTAALAEIRALVDEHPDDGLNLTFDATTAGRAPHLRLAATIPDAWRHKLRPGETTAEWTARTTLGAWDIRLVDEDPPPQPDSGHHRAPDGTWVFAGPFSPPPAGDEQVRIERACAAMAQAIHADIVGPWLETQFGVVIRPVVDSVTVGLEEYGKPVYGGPFTVHLTLTMAIERRLAVIGAAKAGEQDAIDDAIRRTNLPDSRIAKLVGCDRATIWRRRTALVP